MPDSSGNLVFRYATREAGERSTDYF